MMTGILLDAKLALRSLIKAPTFMATAVLTLALGIGANSAIFTVVNGVLLKPLPFADPDSLVGVWHTAPGLGFDQVNQSPALHFTYLDEGTVFDEIGMWDDAQVSVTGLDEPEQVRALMVTDATLRMLRIPPQVGRIFTAQDDLPGTPETVILSHGYWQNRFGGDRSVVGRSLTIEGRLKEVIGVMPSTFRFLRADPDLFLPFRFDRGKIFFGNFSYQGIARLKPGTTVEQANRDIDRLIPVAVEKFPRGLTLGMVEEARFAADIHPLKQDAIGDVGNVLWVLLGTVGLVLVVACANVANIYLVRAESRQQELAVRMALGADRAHVVRKFLFESTCLGVLGGIAGLALAFVGIRFLVFLGPESLPRLREIGFDLNVLAFNLGTSLVAGLLFGAVAALKYRNPVLAPALKEGGRGGSDGRERHFARDSLVVSQVALALVLLVGSGLMIRSFIALRGVHPGFERPEDVFTFRVSVPEAEAETLEEAARTHERILDRVRQIPGIESAGISFSITMDSWDSNDAVYVEDFPTGEDQIPPIRRFKWISPGYFETMKNPVLAGRSISWPEVRNHASVVVVTENFAREYWGDPASALGKRIRQDPDSPWREIVGVVGNVHDDGVEEEATAIIYWPMLIEKFWGQDVFAMRSMAYALRTPRVGSPGLVKEVRGAVWSVNSNLPLASVQTLDEILARSTARTSFTLIMLAIAAGVALLLGSVGIYGVISYAVSQRTREIGVRMALGAREGDVSRMVVRKGLQLGGIGVVLGLAAAYGLTQLMSALLFGVSPVDPITFGSVALGLSGIAMAASYIPARRAARVDPIEALRWE